MEFAKGNWFVEINNKQYYLRYQIKDENGQIVDVCSIIINKFTGGPKIVYHLYRIEINIVDKTVIDILIEKLKEIKNEYKLPDETLDECIKFLNTNLSAPLTNYKEGNVQANDIIKLYSVAYLPLYGFYYLLFNREQLQQQLPYHQRDLDLLSRSNLLAFLTQGFFDFKTDDADLIIKLANNWYENSAIKKYEKEHGSLFPYWLDKYSHTRVNYAGINCALMYAKDALLSDKKFLIRYIDNTAVNPDVMKYIADAIKEEKDFRSHCLVKGYKEDAFLIRQEIKTIIEPGNQVESLEESSAVTLDTGLTITYVDEINIPKKADRPRKDIEGRKHDYLKTAETSMNNGAKAEEIVVKLEKKKLQAYGRDELSRLVEWSSKDRGDGLGYDVISFDEKNGSMIFIEVKSTSSDKFTDFKMSKKELEFAKNNLDSYRLYWISDSGSPNPKLKIITAIELLSSFDAEPTEYVMQPKLERKMYSRFSK